MRLFRITADGAIELPARAATVEVELQRLIESNLECFFGARLIAAAYRFSGRPGGEIDAVGLDENGSPVVLEFKRHGDQNVIAQGLSYLEWLLDHRADFRNLAEQVVGRAAADGIDWTTPRLICVAGAFSAHDEHLVDRVDRSVELVRYRIFGPRELLSLEVIKKHDVSRRGQGGRVPRKADARRPARAVKTVIDRIEQGPAPLVELYDMVEEFALSLGDDVTRKITKHYVAFRKLRNFLCVQVLVAVRVVVLHLNVDPATVRLEEGFTRDVTGTGHLGTGDLEVRVRDSDDLEAAKDLIRSSYGLS